MITIDQARCNGCGACVEICPRGAIYLVEAKAVVDLALCTECEACVTTCPTQAIAVHEGSQQPVTEPSRVPAPRPEPEPIQVKVQPSPPSLRASVLPAVGAALAWTGREVVPRLAAYLLEGLDQWRASQSKARRPQRGRTSANGQGGGRQHRQRRRGGRGGNR